MHILAKVTACGKASGALIMDAVAATDRKQAQGFKVPGRIVPIDLPRRRSRHLLFGIVPYFRTVLPDSSMRTWSVGADAGQPFWGYYFPIS